MSSVKFKIRELHVGSIIFLLVLIGVFVFKFISVQPTTTTVKNYDVIILSLLSAMLIYSILMNLLGKEIIIVDENRIIHRKFPYFGRKVSKYEFEKIKNLKIEEIESTEFQRLFGFYGPKVSVSKKFKLTFKYNEMERQLGVGMDSYTSAALKKLIVQNNSYLFNS